MLRQEVNRLTPGANYDTTWLLAHRLCWLGTLGYLPAQPHPDPRQSHPTQAGAPGCFSQDPDGRWQCGPLPTYVHPFSEAGPRKAVPVLVGPSDVTLFSVCSSGAPPPQWRLHAGWAPRPPSTCLTSPPPSGTSLSPSTGPPHYSRDYWPPATGNTSPHKLGLHGHENWRGSELSPAGSSTRDTQGCRRGWVGGYVSK